MTNKKATLDDAPMAIASSGQLIANTTHLGTGKLNPSEALKLALATGRPIFIGVAMTTAESLLALKKVDDAALEIFATTIKVLMGSASPRMTPRFPSGFGRRGLAVFEPRPRWTASRDVEEVGHTATELLGQDQQDSNGGVALAALNLAEIPQGYARHLLLGKPGEPASLPDVLAEVAEEIVEIHPIRVGVETTLFQSTKVHAIIGK